MAFSDSPQSLTKSVRRQRCTRRISAIDVGSDKGNMMEWRWDQGRLEYFQFGVLQATAKTLAANDGRVLPRLGETDWLREALVCATEKTYLPSTYKVWRNYKRVFGCQLIATEAAGYLRATELCKALAKQQLTADDYFLHFIKHWSYPSPIFDRYDPDALSRYPLVSAIKLLAARWREGTQNKLSIDELVDLVGGSESNGSEDLDYYQTLKSTGASLEHRSDEFRQLRELLIFASQLSCLKWSNPHLILDLESREEAEELVAYLQPKIRVSEPQPANALMQMGTLSNTVRPKLQTRAMSVNSFDIPLVELNHGFARHLQFERSPSLRELYFAASPKPSVCTLCERDLIDEFEWGRRLVQVHHVAEFSMPVAVDRNSTSLEDVVGLCPNCHIATHQFILSWLDARNQPDFASRAEARAVFEQVRKAYVRD